MAGERLLKRLHQRGGSDSDYCDLVTGTVISTSPLRVQLSNDMIIDDNFITLGKAIGKRKLIGINLFSIPKLYLDLNHTNRFFPLFFVPFLFLFLVVFLSLAVRQRTDMIDIFEALAEIA